jgi:hypothetical protein
MHTGVSQSNIFSISRHVMNANTESTLEGFICDKCGCSKKECKCLKPCFNTNSLPKEVIEDGVSYSCEVNENKTIMKVYNGADPYGVVLKEEHKRPIMYKFCYRVDDTIATKFIESTLFKCRSVDHIMQHVNPLLQSAVVLDAKQENDLYKVSLNMRTKTGTNVLSIDVEHAELKRLCSVLRDQTIAHGVLMAKNSDLSVYCDLDDNMIKFTLHDNKDNLLASIGHDWSPFSDMIQHTEASVSDMQGLQTLLQQQTRMFHSSSCVTAENESMSEMYRTCNNKLHMGASVISKMGLISDGISKKDEVSSENRDWVTKRCGLRVMSVPLDKSMQKMKIKDDKTKISCFFSGSVRYAIAHKNQEVTNVLVNQHGMSIEDVTAMLMSGIASCANSGIEATYNEKPCKKALLLNSIDFPLRLESSIETRRMNACRHTMGTTMNTFKLQQNYLEDDIFVHICKNDGGSCVFSKNIIKNIVSVYLSVNNTAVHNSAKYVARKTVAFERTSAENDLMRFRNVMSDIEHVDEFSLHRAALQLAHINSACLQNPGTQLSIAHHYLRSCWLKTHLYKLGVIYPNTVNDIKYCTSAAKLSSMGKTPIGSSNFWYMVPFCT